MKLKSVFEGEEIRGAVIISRGFGCSELIIDNATLVADGTPLVDLEFMTADGRRIIRRAVKPLERGTGVTLILETEVNDALAHDSSSLFRVNAAGAQFNAQLRGSLKTSDSQSQGRQGAALPPQQEAMEETEPENKTVAKPREPEVAIRSAPPPAARKSPLPWILAALALLLALLAACFFFWPRPDGAPQTGEPEPAASAAAQQSAAASAASGEAQVCTLDYSDNDTELLKSCMESKPDSGMLLDLAGQALRKNRCEIAVRIYSSLGRTGDGQAALIYANLFDPAADAGSDCVKKDAAKAIYWYGKARDLGNETLKEQAGQAIERLQAAK